MSDTLVLPKFADLKISARTRGWGPTGIPEEFKNMPFQPFSKETRLGKIADWSGCVYQDGKSKNRYTSQFGGGGQYSYYHDEDDVNFQTVSSAKLIKNNYVKNRQRYLAIKNRKMSNSYMQNQGKKKVDPRMPQHVKKLPQTYNNTFRQKMAYNRQDPRNQKNRVNRNPSIQLKDHWLKVDEIDLSRLRELNLPNVKPPVDAGDFGVLDVYNTECDSISVKNEKNLSESFYKYTLLSISDDPIILRLAEINIANVFMSSAAAEILMCCTKSVFPWDLVVLRLDCGIMIDVRGNPESVMLTVGETAPDPPTDEVPGVNSAKNLNHEATLINLQLKRHFLSSGKKFSLKNTLPSAEADSSDEESSNGDDAPSLAYRYRVFDLGGLNVVIRCEVDGVLPGSTKPKFITVHALNETITKGPNFGDWRSKLDTQKGAIVANELKNNSFKLSRWTCASILAGASQMKFGFVSRTNQKERKNHVILGVQQFIPRDFAQQINFNMDNAFGILKCILDHLNRLPTGRYIIMRDPSKAIIRILSASSKINSSEDDDSDCGNAKNSINEDEATIRKQNLMKKAETRLKAINEALGATKWSA